MTNVMITCNEGLITLTSKALWADDAQAAEA